MIRAPWKGEEVSEEDGNLPVNEFLSNLVKNEKAFISGHFQLNGTMSARDWINLERLFAVKNDRFIDPITEIMYKHVIRKYKRADKEIVLVGLNYYGAILASVLGYRYYVPFTYYFHDKDSIDEIENEIREIKSRTVIIITDVIVFGKSACGLVDHLEEIKGVDDETKYYLVSLFERKADMEYLPFVYSHPKIAEINILNDEYDIEICQRNAGECIFIRNERGCRSLNG